MGTATNGKTWAGACVQGKAVFGLAKAGRVIYKPSLGSCSWAQISQISASGVAPNIFKIGDEKNITLTGGEVLTLRIYDFNHDDLTTGGKAGITFGMKNLMAATRQMNAADTNVGGFTGSAMYAWLQGDLFNSLPSDLQAVIKPVNKKTSAGNKSSTINTNGMNVFLFAEVEYLGTISISFAGEGAQYPVFTDATSRIKYLANGSGIASHWWSRSPRASLATTFCAVLNSGSASNGSPTQPQGVNFGFCV